MDAMKLERLFSTDMPGFRFLRNVMLLSIAGLLPVLALYVLITPGFASALGQGGPGLQRFLRQVLTNGLPVVVVINYVGFLLYALSHQNARPSRDPALLALIDILARVALFFGLHALIYVLSADWYGSFGGSRLTAVSVVALTLARSAFFENISGVYFYATFVSAIPLYMSAFRRSHALRRVRASVRFRAGPIVLAVAVFAIAAVLLTVLAQVVTRLQG